MEVHDNLFAPEELESLRAWLLGQPLIHGWRAHSQAPGSFWHRNFVLPGSRPHHYDSKAWHPEMTFERLLAEESPLSIVARQIQARFFGNAEITRVWMNVQAFGDESAFHRDFPADFAATARSVILYPVPRWERDWGGDLVVLGEGGEIESAALVKPGRVVAIPGCAPHAVRPISRYCNELRLALVFGGEEVL